MIMTAMAAFVSPLLRADVYETNNTPCTTKIVMVKQYTFQNGWLVNCPTWEAPVAYGATLSITDYTYGYYVPDQWGNLQYQSYEVHFESQYSYHVAASCGASVTLGSVTGADYIGNDGDNVYAAGADNGYVTITLNSSDPNVPVDWEGGEPGNSQLQRRVHKTTADSTYHLKAKVYGQTVLRARIRVYRRAPSSPCDVTVNVSPVQDNDVLLGFNQDERPFGAAWIGENLFAADEQYNVYYDNKKWKFCFSYIGYDVRWGTTNLQRADVTNPNANPFPLGYQMASNSSEYSKKFTAKQDLRPLFGNWATYEHYWSSAAVRAHELDHISYWTNDFYVAKMREAGSWIATQEVDVTLQQMEPGQVLSSKITSFHNKIVEKTNEALGQYNLTSEAHARAAENVINAALSDAITP